MLVMSGSKSGETGSEAAHGDVFEREVDALAAFADLGDEFDEGGQSGDRPNDGGEDEELLGEEERRVRRCRWVEHKSRIAVGLGAKAP